MTKNCNLKCNHCYLSCGPNMRNTTVSQENFKSMVDHLPKRELIEMMLTGGEIFTLGNQLNFYIESIEKENSLREDKISLSLQTNGFWLKEKNAEKTLKYLRGKKVRGLDIASNDEYHLEQGFKITKKDIELASKFMEISYRGTEKEYVVPTGRAKNIVSTKKAGYEGKSCKNALIKKDFNINNQGFVYPCCYQFFNYPGNIFEEPLYQILNKATKDPRFNALDREGIKGIVEYDGFKIKEFEEMIEEYGVCGACSKVYEKEK